jgi:CTP:molybdopterin cytidylyltransferase MocA
MSRGDGAVDVVVLASGVNHIPLFPGYEPGYKALIPFHGKPSIQYVLEALDQTPGLGRLCVEGPVALLTETLGDRLDDGRLILREGGATFLESIVIGLETFPDAPEVLFVTADIPLLTPEAVADFLAARATTSTEYAENLCISVVPREAYTGPYTHFTKPFNRYRDVSLCHGNLFLASPALLSHPNLRPRIERLYAGRKNALLSTLALGWQIAVAYMVGVELLHVTRLGEMSAYASHHFGFGIVPVLTPHPEITIDIDEPDDYDFVRDRIEERFACNCAS